ncbi:MAG: copper chaperone PCu(A)C [Gammaproteobacteria bacterium]|nr:copper chaperone PCu(A)C [Gammaproteobacteria bacterium]
MKSYPLLSVLFSLFFFSQSALAESALTFEGAWIAEAPPSSKVNVAYMEINNPGDQEVKVVSATSENFTRISFHQTQQKNDMATMQHMDTLTIPAKGKLVLEAGSHHIMLFNPVKKLKAGDQVNLDLKLENDDIIKLVVPVKNQNTDHNSHDHSAHMHH